MILDQQLILSDSQTLALSFSGTPYLSTNTIDLGAAQNIPLEAYALPAVTTLTGFYDIGRGSPVGLLVQIVTACTSGGSATVKVDLISSAAAALTSPTILQSSDLIPVASLVVGYQFRFGAIPAGIAQRYLGVQYTIGTANITAGAVTAALVIDKQTSTSIG